MHPILTLISPRLRMITFAYDVFDLDEKFNLTLCKNYEKTTTSKLCIIKCQMVLQSKER